MKANFVWTFLGTLAFAVSNWCVLMLLAKLGSVEMVGQFATGLAVTQPILILAQLQLHDVGHGRLGRVRFGHYAALRVLTTALALAAIVAVALSMERDETVVVAAVGFAYAVDSLSDVLYGYLQATARVHEENRPGDADQRAHLPGFPQPQPALFRGKRDRGRVGVVAGQEPRVLGLRGTLYDGPVEAIRT